MASRDLCARQKKKRADTLQPIALGVRLAVKVLSGRKGPALTIIRDYAGMAGRFC